MKKLNRNDRYLNMIMVQINQIFAAKVFEFLAQNWCMSTDSYYHM